MGKPSISGQMSLFDFLSDQEPEKTKKCGDDDPPCAWKDGSHCDTCQRAPKPQKGDCATCKWRIWLHRNGGTMQGCEYHGGHDGCHYERKITCRSCLHMRRCTWGFMDYHGFACFGFGISKSQDIDQKVCNDYEPATDGEAWRTSDEAAQKWIEGEEDDNR